MTSNLQTRFLRSFVLAVAALSFANPNALASPINSSVFAGFEAPVAAPGLNHFLGGGFQYGDFAANASIQLGRQPGERSKEPDASTLFFGWSTSLAYLPVVIGGGAAQMGPHLGVEWDSPRFRGHGFVGVMGAFAVAEEFQLVPTYKYFDGGQSRVGIAGQYVF